MYGGVIVEKENINKKQTIEHMKRMLYEYQYYLRSLVFTYEYQNNNKGIGISEELANKDSEYAKKENVQKRNRASYIIAGLKYLSDKDRQLIVNYYILGQTKKQLSLKNDYVVESTINRRIAKALYQLAIILNMEISTKCN